MPASVSKEKSNEPRNKKEASKEEVQRLVDVRPVNRGDPGSLSRLLELMTEEDPQSQAGFTSTVLSTSTDNGLAGSDLRWGMLYSKLSESERQTLFKNEGYIRRGEPQFAKAIPESFVKFCQLVHKDRVTEKNNGTIGRGDPDLESLKNNLREDHPYIKSISVFFIPPNIFDRVIFRGNMQLDDEPENKNVNNERIAITETIIGTMMSAERSKQLAASLACPILIKNRRNLDINANYFREIFGARSGGVVMASGHFWRDDKFLANKYSTTANHSQGWKVVITSDFDKHDPGIAKAVLAAYNIAQILSATTFNAKEITTKNHIFDYHNPEIIITPNAEEVWDKNRGHLKAIFTRDSASESMTITIDRHKFTNGRSRNPAAAQIDFFSEMYSPGSREAAGEWKVNDEYNRITLPMALMRYLGRDVKAGGYRLGYYPTKVNQ